MRVNVTPQSAVDATRSIAFCPCTITFVDAGRIGRSRAMLDEPIVRSESDSGKTELSARRRGWLAARKAATTKSLPTATVRTPAIDEGQ